MKRHRGGGGVVAASTLQALDRGKPFRDRPVNSKKLACPECGAKAGSCCISVNGNEKTSPHRARYRLAIRAEVAQWAPAAN